MLRKRLFQTALAFVMLGAAVVLPQTPAFAAAYGPYYLIDFNSGRCIDDPNSNTSNNTTMTIYDCLDGTNQRWYNDDLPGANQYWIKNQVSGKCLTVQGASMANNAPVIQYTCNAGANEVWYYDDQGITVLIGTASGIKGGRVYKIRNQKSGLCLTVKNANPANGSTLLQYDCNSPGSNKFVEN